MQPLVNVSVGNQWLKLVFDLSSGNTLVYVREYEACTPVNTQPCYSYNFSRDHGTVKVCKENNRKVHCSVGRGKDYPCTEELPGGLSEADSHSDSLVVDGLRYSQMAVEAKDDMQVNVFLGAGPGQTSIFPDEPFRLLVQNMSVSSNGMPLPLRLFEGTSGLLGASGPSLSCRTDTPWSRLMKQHYVSLLALDFEPPPMSKFGEEGAPAGHIVFNEVREGLELLWSEPKQTGDSFNDGTYEFLMYHPSVCGVDLLYNTSSNWLVVVDTSGPCLALPAFLFDRLMVQLPVACPFDLGEPSNGQLCSPRRVPSCGGTAQGALCRFPFEYQGTRYTKCTLRDSDRPWCSTDHFFQGHWGYCDCQGSPPHDANLNITLPSLTFSLEDSQDPSPETISVPLERLVFNSEGGDELLCIARTGRDGWLNSADMMANTITLGSLAVSAMKIAISLENGTIGFASLANAASESSANFCTPPVSCASPMQNYYPPLNICEDPYCSEYVFTTLDEQSKTCVWSRTAPVTFAILLIVLGVMDFVSHFLYKQVLSQAAGELSTQ